MAIASIEHEQFPAVDSAGDARRTLVRAVLVALVLRLVVVAFLYPDQLKPANDHWSFGYEGGRIARSIVMGRGFSDPLFPGTGATGMMPPIHPYMVAGVFKLFGIYTKASAIVLLSLNAMFSALTCIPIFFIARKCFGLRTAKAAAWAWALFPYAILLSGELIWSTCLATLMLGLLFWMVLHLEESRLAAWAGFGLLAGVSILTNPSVLPVFPFLIGYACYQRHRRGERWPAAAMVACLAVVTVMIPWQVRNYRVFGRFVPLRNNFWSQVWVGNNGDTALSMEHIAYPSGSAAEAEEFGRLGEMGYMEAKRWQAINFLAGHPGWVMRQSLRRFVYTWTGIWSLPKFPLKETFDTENPFDPGHVVLYTGLTLLAAIGLRQAFRQQIATRWLFVTVLASLPAVYYVTQSYVRYRHPIDPLMVMLAAYALTSRQDAPKHAPR